MFMVICGDPPFLSWRTCGQKRQTKRHVAFRSNEKQNLYIVNCGKSHLRNKTCFKCLFLFITIAKEKKRQPFIDCHVHSNLWYPPFLSWRTCTNRNVKQNFTLALL